jgi:hypothetical protein
MTVVNRASLPRRVPERARNSDPRKRGSLVVSALPDALEQKSGLDFDGLKIGRASRHGHNYFNILFVVIFFASFVAFLIHFG